MTDEPADPAVVDVGRKSSRIGGISALLSLALLGASLNWAHHRGVRSDLLVSCWASTAVGALWFSIRSRRASHAALEVARVLAKLGISLAAVSLAALAVAGIALARGMYPGAGCGGG